MILRLGVVLASLGLLAFVLPGPRVISEIADARRKQLPLHVETSLSGVGDVWPGLVASALWGITGLRRPRPRAGVRGAPSGSRRAG